MDMGSINHSERSVASPNSWRFSSTSLGAEVDGESPVPLASLWRPLIEGSARALDTFVGPQREYVLVGERNCPARSRLAPRPRDLAVVRSALQGQTQKAIAIELGLLGGSLSAVLGNMHLDAGPRTGSLFLAAAAFVHYEQRATATASVRTLILESGVYQVYSIRRPELVLADLLAPDEIEVARMIVEGWSTTEMARAVSLAEVLVVARVHEICKRVGVATRWALLSTILEAAFPPVPG